jgi:toxin ParE1/3/4
MKFVLTQLARRDLLEIGRTTQQRWERQQRKTYLAEIDKSFRLLADHPGIGTDCREVHPGYRKHPCQKHVIYYKPLEDRILIVRVLHQAMDTTRHLPPDDML